MQEYIIKYGRLLLQLFLLWIIFQLGTLVTSILKLPLPGNVFGMLILFALLTTGIIPIKWVKDGSELLLKHLAFFFIPIAVGLMALGSLLASSGIWLLTTLTLSAVISIPITGKTVQTLNKRRKKEY